MSLRSGLIVLHALSQPFFHNLSLMILDIIILTYIVLHLPTLLFKK